MEIPRAEYPRPQFVRDRWLCLNGKWQFEIDQGDSGIERGLLDRRLTGSIIVPFCAESKLSGIGNADYLNAVWYRRELQIPAEWTGQRILLHFQAADYDTTVWVNGQEVARHRGGWTGFSADITAAAKPGEQATIVVRCRDYNRIPGPQGKQSRLYHNSGCHYTRVTGIWQTVWMEPVPQMYLTRPRITPDLPGRLFHVEQFVRGKLGKGKIRYTLKLDGDIVSRAEAEARARNCSRATLPVPGDKLRLWEIGVGGLYDLEIELIDEGGDVIDRATSYCGMRSVQIDGLKVLINGRPVFQRLVLDQGWYPDGLLTAPTDEALIGDIRLAMEAGFNGARLHQKVFEERFLYHADRMGYLCWGEFADWGIDPDRPDATIVAQWLEALERDYSHPSIIGWCPLNETSKAIGDQIDGLHDLTHALYLATRAYDSTRPVIDASGYAHRVVDADIYDSHDYDQNPSTFRERHAGTVAGDVFINKPWQLGRQHETISVPYAGQPYFVSEFGGIWWNPDARPGEDSWGYGDRCKTLEEFYARFEGLCSALLDNPGMFGYCYTQLTDVFQEQNGIYRFDRSMKFDISRIRAIQARPAAIEKQ